MPSRVVVHYRWHALFGEEIEVQRRFRLRDQVMLVVLHPDGSRMEVPEWMTRRSACDAMAMAPRPICSLAALLEVRGLLNGAVRARVPEHEGTGQ